MERDAGTAAARLSVCLEEERRAILAGDLAKIAELARTKEALIPQLLDARPDPGDLRKLQDVVRRNARLLEAAARGLRSVLDRIAAIRDGGPKTKTYSNEGRTTDLGRAKSTFERRA